MRTEENYRNLVDGYVFSFGLLKKIDKKIYKLFTNTKDMLESCGNKFSLLVRNLRIDFSQSNDDKDIDDPEIVVVNKGILKETFAMSYLPAYDYCWTTLYQKESVFGSKRMCYMLYPVNEAYICTANAVPVLDISTLNEQGEVAKNITYYAGFSDDALEIIKKDKDKPKNAKAVISIPFDELESLRDESMNVF